MNPTPVLDEDGEPTRCEYCRGMFRVLPPLEAWGEDGPVCRTCSATMAALSNLPSGCAYMADETFAQRPYEIID